MASPVELLSPPGVLAAPARLQGADVAAIRRLKESKNALLLAHNYVAPEIQDLADKVGDSLALAREAAARDNPLIVFCAVHFMAETAAIMARPDQKVVCPDPEAGCSLADTITAPALRAWKARHPGALVVAYVNTSAAVKAEADICCTSSNAAAVVRSLPADQEILFLPDMFLGAWVEEVTGRKLQVWPGECHVHASLPPERVRALMARHPDAEFLIHPECGCSTSCMYLGAVGDLPRQPVITSTGGMISHAKGSLADTFVVATETGILHPLRRDLPEKEFIPASAQMVCQYMKMVTLPKLRLALEREGPVVTVPGDIRPRARRAIERMLAVGG